MLVLTRKTNQSIMIGDDVEVTVLAVSRDKIRLGITAPRSIPVYRKEVYVSINEDGDRNVDEDDDAVEPDDDETADDAVEPSGDLAGSKKS